MGVFQRHLWAGKAKELIGVRLRLNLRCVHNLTARPPLTAYGNVRVGPTAMSFVRSAYFLRRHFCGYRDPASTKNSLKAEQAGAFFSSDQRRKKAHRTGRSKRVFKWYERAFKLQECQPSNGWVGPCITQPLGANTDNVNLDTQLVRPWSSVMSICQTWVLRPMCTGRAIPFTQPLGTPRIWLALMSSPTMR